MVTDYPYNKLYWIGGWLFDFTKIITIFIFIILILHFFFYTIFSVQGNSMEPSLINGDLMLIDRISYKFHFPQRGDIIALNFPGENNRKYVKRIIGLPNESLKIESGQIFVNGHQTTISGIESENITQKLDIKLSSTEYFVIGDNLAVSSDSRIWGPLTKDSIIGKAVYRLTNKFQWSW